MASRRQERDAAQAEQSACTDHITWAEWCWGRRLNSLAWTEAVPAPPLPGLASICQIKAVLATEPQDQLLRIQPCFTRINCPGLLEWLLISMHSLNCSSDKIAVNSWLPGLCACQKASSLNHLKAKPESEQKWGIWWKIHRNYEKETEINQVLVTETVLYVCLESCNCVSQETFLFAFYSLVIVTTKKCKIWNCVCMCISSDAPWVQIPDVSGGSPADTSQLNVRSNMSPDGSCEEAAFHYLPTVA